MTSSSHVHNVTFDIPGEDDKVHELYTIPCVGEIVIFDEREWKGYPRHKVIDVIHNIRKSGVFGWVGVYTNHITVVLEQA